MATLESEKPQEMSFADRWLETTISSKFKVWHILFLIVSVIFTILIFLCCCIRFRIPRTKQEIEADYMRKKITRKFQRQLYLIQDSEMDEMDLLKALERIRNELVIENAEIVQEPQEEEGKNPYPLQKSMDKKRTNSENTCNSSPKLNAATSEEKLIDVRTGFGTKLVTIVNALNVLRVRRSRSTAKDGQIPV